MSIGGSVDYCHALKLVSSVLVAKTGIVPPQTWIMWDPELVRHGFIFFQQILKHLAAMFQHCAGRRTWLWQSQAHAWVQLYSSKDILRPGKACNIVMLQVGILESHTFRDHKLSSWSTAGICSKVSHRQVLRVWIHSVAVSQLHFFCPIVLPSIGAQWSLRYKQQRKDMKLENLFKPGSSIVVVSFDKRQADGSSAVQWARHQRCPWLILVISTRCFWPCYICPGSVWLYPMVWCMMHTTM